MEETATFSGTLKGGTRTARVGGKSIHVPRDMNYADFKAVYVDKTTSLKDWQAARDRSGVTLKNSTSSGKIFLHESSSSDKIGAESSVASSSQPPPVSQGIKEADEFATKVLGVPNASYSGCAVSVAQKWNKRLQEVFQDFPELKRQIKFVGEVHERNKAIQEKLTQVFVNSFSENHPRLSAKIIKVMAESRANQAMERLAVPSGSYAKSLSTDIIIVRDFNGVTINADHAKNPVKLKADLNDAVRRGWPPRGCDTIESLVDHEIGHQLDAMLGLSELKTIRDLYDGLITTTDGKPDYDKITEGLSEYAWNNDNPDRYSEFIAEAWAEYRNNRNAREIARKVGKIIEEEYRKKFHGSGDSK